MRVKLTLQAQTRHPSLPVTINYAIAGLVYRILGQASEQFATRLHDEGFADEGRRFKLFTFSRLSLRRSHLSGQRLVLDDPAAELLISSPVSEFIEHFVTGLFQSEQFHLAGTAFVLTAAETLPLPDFSAATSFRALSPITESVRDEQNRVRFLTPEDDWSAVVQRNLLRKYRALYGHDPTDTSLRWQWDHEYLRSIAAQGKRASALIDINSIRVRGWLAPFTVEGSRELLELGYEAGFGSRNSMGFGMAGMINL
ncbi:MAG TPA: CRISPR-associated endoribonuclease Cas6 [Blastocatellia bacterium]|nr:CRISPR-associated endoribonuclease Cas6 [Blastocatellia bacterium]